MNQVKFIFVLIICLFLSACDSSSSSPAIFEGVGPGTGNPGNRQKIQPPEQGSLKINTFSFDELGNNFESVNQQKKDLDIDKLDYLKEATIELVKNNDIVIFNNIIGSNGLRHFIKIIRSWPLDFKCYPNYTETKEVNYTVVCSNNYFKLTEAPGNTNFLLEDLAIDQSENLEFMAQPTAGFHAQVTIYNFTFQLVAINLFKDSDFTNPSSVRIKQVTALTKYLDKKNIKEKFIIIGDMQNDDERELDVQQRSLSENLSSMQVSSPSDSTYVLGDKVMNHSFYEAVNIKTLRTFNLGHCSSNSTPRQKANYMVRKSLYCPTTFLFKYKY